MGTSGAPKGGNRRARSSKGASGAESVDNTTSEQIGEQEVGMAEQEKTANNGEASTAPKSNKLELAQKSDGGSNGRSESGLAVAKQEEKGDLQVGSFSVAGLRPIAPDNLEVFAMILNNRPITASHLKVMEYSLPGNRPIFASDLVIREDLSLPGGRPIAASDPHLLEASLLPGGRPVASNEIDDSEALMGFLD